MPPQLAGAKNLLPAISNRRKHMPTRHVCKLYIHVLVLAGQDLQRRAMDAGFFETQIFTSRHCLGSLNSQPATVVNPYLALKLAKCCFRCGGPHRHGVFRSNVQTRPTVCGAHCHEGVAAWVFVGLPSLAIGHERNKNVFARRKR